MTTNIKTKKCKACGNEYLLKDFQTDNNSIDGKWKLCPKCESFRQKNNRIQPLILANMMTEKLNGYTNIFITRRRFKLWQKAIDYIWETPRVFSDNQKNLSIVGNYTIIAKNKKYNCININLTKLKKIFGFSEEFFKGLIQTISHESIHHWLAIEEGMQTTRNYDNIYHPLRDKGYIC